MLFPFFDDGIAIGTLKESLIVGYQGMDKCQEIKAAQEAGRFRPDIEWQVAARSSRFEPMAEGMLTELTRTLKRKKAQIRARVEHPLLFAGTLDRRHGHELQKLV